MWRGLGLFFGLHLGNKVVSSKQTHLQHTCTHAQTQTHTLRRSRWLRPPPGSGGRSVQRADGFCRLPAASSVGGLNQSLWEKKKTQQHSHMRFCKFGEFKTWKSHTWAPKSDFFCFILQSFQHDYLNKVMRWSICCYGNTWYRALTCGWNRGVVQGQRKARIPQPALVSARTHVAH